MWSRAVLRAFVLTTVRNSHCSTRSMAQGVREETPLWSYTQQSVWGNVDGWEVANLGKRQSPINISTHLVTINRDLTPLELGLPLLQKGTFENTGHTVQFTPSGSSTTQSLTTPHGTYTFKQFHFHWGPTSKEGSEHCIDGKYYALEIHFVYAKTSGPKDTTDDCFAVLGVMCQADPACDCKGTHWDTIKFPQEPSQTITVDGMEILRFLPQELDYYYYKGSLTTPPCSENVLWYVIKQPLRVPEDFLQQLRKIKDFDGETLTHTYRQCMPLHGRTVETPAST